MIDRYNTKEMKDIWSDKTKYNIWLKIEISVIKALNLLGIVSDIEKNKIIKNVKIDINLFEQMEKKYKHDIVAFTRMLDTQLGEEKRWLHFGLTSTDVVDTCNSYRIKISNDVLINEMKETKNILYRYAIKYKYQLIMGRTHGVHAEPTTIGYKFANWYMELNRNIERFMLARKQVEVSKISGSVGTFCNIDPFVEKYIAEEFNLQPSYISTQTLQRDRHAFLFSVFALISSLIEKISIEIRNLHRTEIAEIQEGFSENQKGSSSMPHKKNPIGLENLCGCCRLIRAYMLTSFENIPLWGERDISHSSNERIIFTDIFSLLHYVIRRFNYILVDLNFNTYNIDNNLEISNYTFISQRLMNFLIKKGLSREESYDIIQELSIDANKRKINFLDIIEKNIKIKKYLNSNDIKSLKDFSYYYSNIDKVYKNIGLI